jgi:hypothetical protein
MRNMAMIEYIHSLEVVSHISRQPVELNRLPSIMQLLASRR